MKSIVPKPLKSRFPVSAFAKTMGRNQPFKRGLRVLISDSVRDMAPTPHNILSDGGREANEMYAMTHVMVKVRKHA